MCDTKYHLKKGTKKKKKTHKTSEILSSTSCASLIPYSHAYIPLYTHIYIYIHILNIYKE